MMRSEVMLTPAETVRIAGLEATCPLCHTVDETVTPEALEAGATWKCTRCGQTWSAERLERVAEYVRFEAAHQLSVR
jgi:transposase-like protein